MATPAPLGYASLLWLDLEDEPPAQDQAAWTKETLGRAAVLLKARQFVQAQRVAQQVVEAQPEEAEADFALAASLLARGLLPRCYHVLTRLLARDLVRYRARLLSHALFAPLRQGDQRQRLRALLAMTAERYREALAEPGALFVARSRVGFDVYRYQARSARFLRLSDTGRQVLDWGLAPTEPLLVVCSAARWRSHAGTEQQEAETVQVHGIDLASFQAFAPLPLGAFVENHLGTDARARLWFGGRTVSGARILFELQPRLGKAAERRGERPRGVRALARRVAAGPAGAPNPAAAANATARPLTRNHAHERRTQRPLPRLLLDRRRAQLTIAGRARPFTVPRGLNRDPAWSSDGRFVFLARRRGGACADNGDEQDDGISRSELWVLHAASGRWTQIHAVRGALRWRWVPEVGLLLEDPLGVHLWTPGSSQTPLQGRVMTFTREGRLSGSPGAPDDCGG